MSLKIKKGVTLIELLVVIGILGILTLMSVPVFRAYGPKLGLSGSTQELVSDLRYAQQMSVTEQKEYSIKFFPADKKYQILKYGTGIILKEKILPGEIQSLTVADLTDNEVVYNSYGAVKEEGTVVLKNIENQEKTISIKPSGFIEVAN
jgi:prepilin-type N-terminal cleavage/methylation domain-containing protein